MHYKKCITLLAWIETLTDNSQTCQHELSQRVGDVCLHLVEFDPGKWEIATAGSRW